MREQTNLIAWAVAIRSHVPDLCLTKNVLTGRLPAILAGGSHLRRPRLFAPALSWPLRSPTSGAFGESFIGSLAVRQVGPSDES